MKFWKKVLLIIPVFGLMSIDNTHSVVTKQSAIKMGTTVRTKLEPVGLYSEECYNYYYSCMDQFCITDNVDGGSCACSDLNAGFESDIKDIELKMLNANDIRTIEVEKVKAGANVDIVFSGERKYDDLGNVMGLEELEAEKEKENALLSIFDNSYLYEGASIFDDIAEVEEVKVGADLYKMANGLCKTQIPSNCSKDLILLEKTYERQIVSDCKGFENTIKRKQTEADMALDEAYAAVRAASMESFNSANKYNAGECMVEFKKCMQTTDACGKNWENCVFTVATENMQNKKAISTAGTSVAVTDKYNINDSTMEALDSKRNICENVLDQCVAVRDTVWPAFLREAAPTIRLAESKLESEKRQSCLTDISDCIQTACRDDIAGKGVATMDSCLSRPEMARSFCKVEVDTCERMEPLIWGYVTDKLAAMRVDACTLEVKECFTSDDRCGTDFGNCIGVDYDVIKNMCPVDKLVVCKANDENFTIDKLDSMLAGLYLNIDNSALENCQNLVDDKMMELCGSTTDCNRFASDDTIGTSSLKPQKDGNIYRITGMISFGSIKMGMAGQHINDSDSVLGVGEIGVGDYIKEARTKNQSVPNRDGILDSIEAELENIAGTINRAISVIEQDPQVQYCLYGRTADQKSGKFPNLLNQYKQQIAISALRQANDNYNKKLNTEIAEATADASLDLAQYMCQKIGNSNSYYSDMMAGLSVDAEMGDTYSISYDIDTGLNTSLLIAGGGTEIIQTSSDTIVKDVTLSGSGSNKITRALFNRDTRICTVCSTITDKSCISTAKDGWFQQKAEEDCSVATTENCEDIEM